MWHLRVDLHVLDHQGNLVDACGLAALAALMAFRRPDVTVGGGDDGQVRAGPRQYRAGASGAAPALALSLRRRAARRTTAGCACISLLGSALRIMLSA